MKTLLFLCGPNGIGKTTICKEIVHQLKNSAYVDSDPCRFMNPFVLCDETIPTISKNISDLISNYLSCPIVDTVIFSYGFHGRRGEVFDLVIKRLSSMPMQYRFSPFLLCCEEDENIRRMIKDGRSSDRTRRAVDESRKAYNDISYPQIDITRLTVFESVRTIIQEAGLLEDSEACPGGNQLA